VLIELDGVAPRVSPEAFVAPGAVLTGDVRVERQASVWFGAVARGDVEPIVIGEGANVQDGAILHTEAGAPLTLAAGVAIGHGAVVHGCMLEPDVLVGIGAIVLSGARVGSGSVVAAGAVVLEGAEIPPGSLVVGTPGRVVRATDGRAARETCAKYRAQAERYRRALGA
jgi:carbonic anhydrase/acetyltransferase-like protein (isoleucine patch superfamily)